jgi:Zn-dependent peptidase ImmA (M78 family)
MDHKTIKAIINQANNLGRTHTYDIFTIYEKLRYQYIFVNTVEEFCTVRNNKILISNKADPLTVRINLSHELGHILLHHDKSRSIQHEHAANIFAFTILFHFFK